MTRRWQFWAILVVVLATAGLTCWKVFAENSQPASVDVETQQAAKKALSIDNNPNYAKTYSDISLEFLNNRMQVQDEARTKASGFSDAVSFPLTTPSDKEKSLKEVEEEILKCPIYCDMVIRGLKDLTVYGETIGSLNPWMAEFEKTTDEAYKKAETESPRGLEVWLTQKDDGKTYVTDEFRQTAALVCVLLERFENLGIQSLESTRNFNLPLVAKNSSRRTAEAKYQESKPALTLRYVDKAGNEILVIGFNKQDRRFEALKRASVAIQTTVTTTSSGGSGGGGGGDTPTPGPTPDPDPVKDPSQDPVYQGNAEKLGGSNKSTDGTGTFQPTRPEQATDTRHVGDSSSSSSSSSTRSSSSSSTPSYTPSGSTHVDNPGIPDNSSGTSPSSYGGGTVVTGGGSTEVVSGAVDDPF